MVHKIIFSHLFVFISFLSFSSVNNESRFSIITIGPYEDELYSAFGHSGIRYYNKSTGEDVFYNYGIFDFDREVPNVSRNGRSELPLSVTINGCLIPNFKQ